MGITTYSSTFALSGGGGHATSHGDCGAPAAPPEGGPPPAHLMPLLQLQNLDHFFWLEKNLSATPGFAFGTRFAVVLEGVT